MSAVFRFDGLFVEIGSVQCNNVVKKCNTMKYCFKKIFVSYLRDISLVKS